MAPGTVTTIPLEYKLPWETVRPTGENSFEYRLLVQKQAGVDQDIVTVSLGLPSGAELVDVSPKPSAQNSQWLKFEFQLDSDKEVVVGFKVLP